MNKLWSIAVVFALIVFCSMDASAFFTQSHLKWNQKAFSTVSQGIAQECAGRLQIIDDGNTAADIGVLHYHDTTKVVTSYISFHTRGTYVSCLQIAGSDPDLKCFCYGIGTHIIEDRYSHLDDGLTVQYLKTYFANNFLGHMIIEKSFENGHMALIQQQNPQLYNQIKASNSHVLDSLFNETGGSSKYLGLMQELSGVDMSNDAKIFRSGYKGDGFYNTVYKDKLNLPWWSWGIGAILTFLGLTLGFFVMLSGRTRWKFLVMLQWFLIGAIGIFLLFTIFTGKTWQITEFFLQVPPTVGYLHVSDSDVLSYDQKAQQTVDSFFATKELNIDDASGLTYVDREGNQHIGALSEASKVSNLVLYSLIPLFFLLEVWITSKAFTGGKIPRRFRFRRR